MATFAVTLSAPSGRPVSVTYATTDLTATAPADYAALSGTLAFAPGQTAQAVTVTVNGDLVDEADEAFAVNLSGAVNAAISDTQAIGTILDDDEAGVLVDPANLTVVEGGASDAYAVSLATPPEQPVTITLGYDAEQVTLSASSLVFTGADWDVAQDWWAEALPETSVTNTRSMVWWLEQMACDGQGACTPPQAVTHFRGRLQAASWRALKLPASQPLL